MTSENSRQHETGKDRDIEPVEGNDATAGGDNVAVDFVNAEQSDNTVESGANTAAFRLGHTMISAAHNEAADGSSEEAADDTGGDDTACEVGMIDLAGDSDVMALSEASIEGNGDKTSPGRSASDVLIGGDGSDTFPVDADDDMFGSAGDWVAADGDTAVMGGIANDTLDHFSWNDYDAGDDTFDIADDWATADGGTAVMGGIANDTLDHCLWIKYDAGDDTFDVADDWAAADGGTAVIGTYGNDWTTGDPDDFTNNSHTDPVMGLSYCESDFIV